ncbi:MAG: hypothetical protein F7C08_00580 [Desulfurococcales archaeon]|nr:hypothetical protein [Desulfurococcales archaeon]
MYGQSRGVLQLGALLGVYMAWWIYSEAHVASLLGVSRKEGLIAGLLVTITVWVRLQGILRFSKFISGLDIRRIIVIISPFISYILFFITINSKNILISIFSFIIFTLYIGVLLAISSSKIYKETDPSEWKSSILIFKTVMVFFQILTLIFLKIINIDIYKFNNTIYLILSILLTMSIYASRHIYGFIIPETIYKLLELLHLSFINPRKVKLITDNDINRFSSILAGLFVLKIIILPKAIKDDPLITLALYALSYFIGSRVALSYFDNIKLVYLSSIISYFIIISIDPIHAIILLGFMIGFIELSIILLVLNYKPRDIVKTNLFQSIWIIAGSIIVGVTSEFLPNYTPYSILLILISGYVFRNRATL